MDFYGLLTVLTLAVILPSGLNSAFNIDTKNPRIIHGSKEAYFGYKVQQHQIGDKKWLLVGAPFDTNGPLKTGDVYRCPVDPYGNENCTKLNLGRITLSNVMERKNNMRLGMGIATNPKDNTFVACSPLWSHECGSSYYTTGMCSKVNTNFRFFKPVAPALERCKTYMDIIIVLDGSNSIYPWYEVQNFLINILQKFYVGPGQIQVGIIQYGEDVVHEFYLNDFKTVDQVVAAAKRIEQRGGTETNTALGIETARSVAFKRGGRKGVKKVMIVITDGESHDNKNLKKVIGASEKDNITRYAVAVLGSYNRRGINPEAFLNEIRFIASDPDEKHFFKVTDEAALKDIVDALGERIFSLEGTKNEMSFGLEMSQAGFSTHVVEDGILLGAVGAYDWNGAVLKETSQGKVIPRWESYLQEFPEELRNHGAYLGYTVTSLMSANHGRLYVAGAPRFNHTGKVIIFTIQSNENVHIYQSLKGEQIGSYYGSEICTVDVNGDGVTDVLLVGAPMYFSEGREKGKVHMYKLKRNGLAVDGSLETVKNSHNARFGSSISAVPDLNYDSYNDVVVGAPLEDDHQGAIYIFYGYKDTIVTKYKQRIAALELAHGFMYFGQSIHGQLDFNEDGLVDLAVGSLGSATVLWTRGIVQINASIRFEPPRINIFHKDCKRNGRDATCLSASFCFTAIIKPPTVPKQFIALMYNATIDERRYTPRAMLDEDNEKYFHQTMEIFPEEEHCNNVGFHVLETADVKPITFVVDYRLQHPHDGPVLDDGWPTTVKSSVSFWNGCSEDENCVPNLVLKAGTDMLSVMDYCRKVLMKSLDSCIAYTMSFEESTVILTSTQRRMAVDAVLENKGENAYNTVLNISFSRNLNYASLIIKDDSDIKIECTNEEKLQNTKICNVSFPVFRAKAKVSFRLEFEFSRSIFQKRVEIILTASSDSEEAEHTRHDETAVISHLLKYEADLLFTRDSDLKHYEIKSNSSVERYDCIGPPFNYTFKIQNLGFFPVEQLNVKITVPAFTTGGNHLLQLTQFYTNQKNGTLCQAVGNNTISKRKPSEEEMRPYQLLNESNSVVVFVQCTTDLLFNEDVSIYFHGLLCTESLKMMKFKSLKLITSASLEQDIQSHIIFREEDPRRHITLEITKPEDSHIPFWILIGSTLGGLLLFALLVLALWKLGFFQSSKRNKGEDPDQDAKVLEDGR
ncbi:integrin alpha-11 [Protopterus annectens]|uniref:integrin alpha-11 n=1 Tax=Protopterus annectens TaxID=7888 RepID=UPI001CFAA3D3|nr:integrin alpha-11 [Protopterus annectens]